MIGKPRQQMTIGDLVFNARKKRSRSEEMLERINELVNWKKLTAIVEKSYKKANEAVPVFR